MTFSLDVLNLTLSLIWLSLLDKQYPLQHFFAFQQPPCPQSNISPRQLPHHLSIFALQRLLCPTSNFALQQPPLIFVLLQLLHFLSIFHSPIVVASFEHFGSPSTAVPFDHFCFPAVATIFKQILLSSNHCTLWTFFLVSRYCYILWPCVWSCSFLETTTLWDSRPTAVMCHGSFACHLHTPAPNQCVKLLSLLTSSSPTPNWLTCSLSFSSWYICNKLDSYDTYSLAWGGVLKIWLDYIK